MIAALDFGAAIKHRLEQLGLSYDETARSIGKYHQWLSFLIDRKSKPKGTNEVEKLLRILCKKGALVRKTEKEKGKKGAQVIQIPDFEEVDMGEYLGFMFQYFGLNRGLSDQFTRAYNYKSVQPHRLTSK